MIVGQRASEGQQLVRLGAGGDADQLDPPSQQPPLEREIVRDHAPFDAGLDLERLGLDRGGGGGQGKILGRVVPRIGAQKGDQVAESLDERRPGVHAVSLRWGSRWSKLHTKASAATAWITHRIILTRRWRECTHARS